MNVPPNLTTRPMWVRVVALVTAATFMLQGCGGAMDSIDGATEKSDALGAPSAIVSPDMKSIMADISVELVGEPEFLLTEATDADLQDGVEQIQDVAQADPALAEKAAVLSKPVSGVYTCTMTQPHSVSSSTKYHHVKLKTAMTTSKLDNTKWDKVIQTHFAAALEQHIGGDSGKYPYVGPLKESVIHKGWTYSAATKRYSTLLQTQIKFNTTDKSLCIAETKRHSSHPEGADDRYLLDTGFNDFWAAVMAAVAAAILVPVIIMGLVAAFPEVPVVVAGLPVVGTYLAEATALEVAQCFASAAAVYTYELLKKTGTYGGQTFGAATTACVLAVGGPFLYKGEFGTRYAPWITESAAKIRSTAGGFWTVGRESVATALSNMAAWMWEIDGELPVRPGVIGPPS